ncbi:thiamine phosphate synthase [Alteribacter populi]|uniref:thiamine phosphate synthase n=1 Tax=Alteribacter populi TaxID=2011011 RepID=UPI000BBA4702|nr:thiamine phosphate synthase [Alteribacter populi]
MGRVTKENLAKQLQVYFIAGSKDCASPLPLVLHEAIQGGMTIFQFREKGAGSLTGEMKEALALQLYTQCQQAGIPFIINDHIDLAVSIDADGLHIGQEDVDVKTARKRIGKNKILGVSIHSIEEAYEAVNHGADYLGIGPLFETSSKEDANEVTGPNWVRELRANGIDLPIVGIGGITAENGGEVLRAGANGLAVISAISKAASPYQAAREFRQLYNHD